MRRNFRGFYLVLTVCALVCSNRSPAAISLDLMGGSAKSFDTPLTIYQDGQPTIKLTAQYGTYPVGGNAAPYYAIRANYRATNSPWIYSFEILHSKIYLENGPAEVENFRVTFGFNYVMFDVGYQIGGFTFMAGLGPIVGHPRSTVRSQAYEGTGFLGLYSVIGVGSQIAANYRLRLFSFMTVLFETKLTAAYAVVPIASGSALTPNAAVHGLIGLGFDF